MATFVDLHRQTYYGHLNLTSLTEGGEFGPMTIVMVPFHNFGSGGYEEWKPGLLSGSFTANLYQDYDAGALDDQIGTALGTQWAITVVPNPANSVSVGDVCYFSRGVRSQYSPEQGNVGDAAKATLTAKTDTATVRGTVAHPLASRTATGNGTIYALTGPTTSQRLYAALHVTAYSGLTNVVVKVQSDDGAGFGSPTDRLTFSTVTGTTSEFTSVAGYGATETHHRIVYTITGTGSISFIAALGVL